ncbi:hypothetical protein [Pseudarthrobacter sp. SSS035]|uniref:hypothetical protein n=1 Tax=Pseudarthrobacter sp. SSS035 TaxID=2931399 RepID=UPI00200DF942|nr:hypothetical protein [Pseudarthrobacter sp. SSS035]
MGATNVAKVFANWRHLSHREARALLFMANMALDADKPPVYFGGWQAVASALGLDCEGRRKSAEEVYRKTLASLGTAGAVVSSGQAKLGVRAEYALALDPAMTFEPAGTGRNIKWIPLPRTGRPNETLPQVPQQNVAPLPNETLGHVPQQNVGTSPNKTLPPRKTEEPQGGVLEEKRGGTQIAKASSLTNARASELHELDERPSIEDERSRQLAAMEQRVAEYAKSQERKAS